MIYHGYHADCQQQTSCTRLCAFIAVGRGDALRIIFAGTEDLQQPADQPTWQRASPSQVPPPGSPQLPRSELYRMSQLRSWVSQARPQSASSSIHCSQPWFDEESCTQSSLLEQRNHRLRPQSLLRVAAMLSTAASRLLFGPRPRCQSKFDHRDSMQQHCSPTSSNCSPGSNWSATKSVPKLGDERSDHNLLVRLLDIRAAHGMICRTLRLHRTARVAIVAAAATLHSSARPIDCERASELVVLPLFKQSLSVVSF